MSASAGTEVVVNSVEAGGDDFDLENGEDDLLAEALDKVQRAHSAPPEDESDEYETHRILEQSVSPPPDRPYSVKRVASVAPPIEIKYDDIFDDTFTGKMRLLGRSLQC